MSDYNIKIQNCNNIAIGEIPIQSNKLNILFGSNGTGKSTIARAINLVSSQKELTELAPYGLSCDEIRPQIEGVSSDNIAIFDDEYVRQYVYQSDSLISDTFEVLLHSKEYNQAKNNIDDALSKIRSSITENQEIVVLKTNIGELIETIKLTDGDRIDRRGGAKGVLEGKGAYFNPPNELSELEPFFRDESVTKWAAWRLQGFNQFGNKGCCPYCSTGDSEKTNTINRVFSDSFDKVSVETASKILKSLEELKPYMSVDKTNDLISLFGVKNDNEVLENQLTKLRLEADYLNGKLTSILSFNGFSVDRDNIAKLESSLKDMKIDSRVIDQYFVSVKIKEEIDSINSEVDLLLDKVDNIKAEIGKYNKHIRDKVKARKQDINEFLSLGGYRYSFDVEIRGENNAKALLKFIMPDGNPGDIQSPGKHLSWGEKHAFALILFMFDAISKNADLIILDDPISSFDNNKKYAIINRLFKTGDKENSFYQRTVIMLTHDFEPVIDYVYVNAGRQDPSYVCANYIENNRGNLQCTPIKKYSDLLSSVVLLKEMAKDQNIDIAARLGCLRKFIEHQYRSPKEESDAYHVLSSLIHGRPEPTYDIEGEHKLKDNQLDKGFAFIRQYIPEFDYNSVLKQCASEKLIERYADEQSSFIKMLILRAYVEQDREARDRLRESNDVLRKYVDETYHIENDYLYSLDVRRFNIVPNHYVLDADRFVGSETERLDSIDR